MLVSRIGAPGPDLGPRYEVLGELGRGSTSTVWSARHLASGQVRAVKQLREGASSAGRALLQREYWALKRLEHEGLVEAFDEEPTGDRPWFAMEAVTGPRIEPGAAVELAELESIVGALCRVVAYLHGQGLVHGDLKPANLRLDAEGKLRLLDLGFLEQAGAPARALGTLEYMAPEVLRREPRDPRSDVYALGTIAFELLTGHTPFSATHPLALLEAQLSAAPAPISELRPDLPKTVSAAIEACLAKSPADRPASAGHLLESLGWGQSQPVLLFGSELFGRQPDLAEIREQVEAQLEGRAGPLALLGEPGVGKSRLLGAVCAQLRSERSIAVALVEGRGDAPFTLLRDVLGALQDDLLAGGLRLDDERWRALGEAMPHWGSAPPPLEAIDQRARLRQAVGQLFSAVARTSGGLVLAIDDAELCDAASWEVLAPALGRRTQRVAVVTAGRSPLLGGQERVLEPLGPEAVRDMVERALGGSDVGAVLGPLAERTGGRPHRIRQWLIYWRQIGALADSRGRWQLDLRPGGALPGDLAGEIAMELSRLTGDARRLAQLGAILGCESQLADLLALASREGSCLHPFSALAELESAAVLVRAGDRLRLAAPCHDALLAEIAPETAELWHLWAAEICDSQSEARSPIEAALHLAAAGSRGDAGRVLDAATQCLTSGAISTARKLLSGLGQGGLALAELQEATRLQAELFRLEGNGREAVPLFERAIAQARELAAVQGSEGPSGARICRELSAGGRAAIQIGDRERARNWLQEALAIAVERGLAPYEARTSMALGRLAYFDGDPDEARRFYERARLVAQGAGLLALVADALTFMGVMASPGDPADQAALEEAVLLNRQVHNPIGGIDALINLGDRHLHAGRLAEARAAFSEAWDLAGQAGAATEEPIILLNLAQISLESGDPHAARELANQALALARETGRLYPEGFARVVLGQAASLMGEYSEARAAFAEAAARAEQAGNRYLQLAVDLAAGEAALERGALDEAAGILDKAVELAQIAQDAVAQARAHSLAGRFLTGIGEFGEARARLERALDLAGSASAAPMLCRVALGLAYLAWREGDASLSLDRAREALARAEEMGATSLVAEAWLLQGLAHVAGGSPEAARHAFAEGGRLAAGVPAPLIEALCDVHGSQLGLSGNDPARHRKGRATLRSLDSFAGSEGFLSWPERKVGEQGAGLSWLSEILGAVLDADRADSPADLLERLLGRAIAAVGARRGALLHYRDRQLLECATSGMTRTEVVEALPLLDEVIWDLVPIFDDTRWILPLVEDDKLLGLLVVEGPELAGRPAVPYLAEALAIAVSHFERWTQVAGRVERLAFSERLVRQALASMQTRPGREGSEGAAGGTSTEDRRQMLRQALADALRAVGAERIGLIMPDTEGQLEIALALDSNGQELAGDAPFSRSVCQWVLSHRERVHLLDAQGMDGWQQQQSIMSLGLRTIAAVPVGERDRPAGVLYVDSGSLVSAFGAREEDLLAATADVISPLLPV